MEEADFASASNDNLHAESSQDATSRGSGLRLILPPLKSVKALKGKKKAGRAGLVQDAGVKPKIPRPVKLKPLKEVLTKLIYQIKKKDDYAFFLTPVNPVQVPGYADLIKHPMDLGTMSTKVSKGTYRSLDEFAADLRLVTTNAKLFNPPGTIYHTEADRIEAFALEHVAKAAGTVIEHEADWNIDIEREDEGPGAEDDDDEQRAQERDAAVPMDVDGARDRPRSPSVASTQTPVQGPPGLGFGPGARRGPRSGKKQPGMLSESLEADGHLPGYKDGVGVFPPGSDWAELMLALKRKGKRYRTKKERMRMERGGPPFAADGSLDYAEMEDPFTVLSVFLPDPPTRPLLTPLHPTASPSDPTQAHLPPPPGPVALPPSRPLPQFTLPPAPPALPSKKPTAPALTPSTSTATRPTKAKRRFWTVVRNAPGRGRAREREDEEGVPGWRAPREMHAVDVGAFAGLHGTLAMEAGVDVGGKGKGRVSGELGLGLGSEAGVCEAIRGSVELRSGSGSTYASPAGGEEREEEEEVGYWERYGREAQDYVRDVVYGGVDGYAYVRSLAEFVCRPDPRDGRDSEGDGEPQTPPTYAGLGMPLDRWVEQHVVDPLTDGRHRLLRETVQALLSMHATSAPSSSSPISISPCSSSSISNTIDPATLAQVHRSLHAYPEAAARLAELRKIAKHKLDMAALIREPQELFLADGEWAGATWAEERRRAVEAERERTMGKSAAEYLAFAVKTHREAELGPGGGVVMGNVESAEVFAHALEYSAGVIVELARKQMGGVAVKEEQEQEQEQEEMQKQEQQQKRRQEEEEEEEEEEMPGVPEKPPQEDEVMRKLRLNLLALAKRAPLDTIARLPADLVPAHIRHVVPTIDSST